MVSVRAATIEDANLILAFIKGLAEYEKLAEFAVATQSQIEQTLFCEQPKVFSLIAEVDGEAAGFALYFFNYSTFLGQHGIYLEDLYVKPNFRQHKVGFALFKGLAQVAERENCGRIDWAVLDWNQLAIDFYDRLGAKPQTEWTGFRLEDEALQRLIEINQ